MRLRDRFGVASKVAAAGILAVVCAGLGSLPASAATTWTDRTAAGTRNWSRITMSADGSHLAAVITNGDIYTSTDYGATWTDRTAAGSRNWLSITMSADGSHLAAADHGGDIYTSTDYGATWTDRTAAGSRDWQWLAMSSTGSRLVAIVAGGGDIYTSTDYGATWTDRTAAGTRDWLSLAMSADGSHVIAGVTNGDIYTSTDYGATWTDHTTGPRINGGITSSADGSHLAAVMTNGDIYTSTDYGATWTDQVGSAHTWLTLASSADGSQIIGGDFGNVYLSTDYGATWTAQTALGFGGWVVASSADGSHLAAAASGGGIWTASSPAVVSDNGLAAGVESAAPNGGDANNDGIADAGQGNVASFVNAQAGAYVSVATPTGCTVSGLSSEADPHTDSGYIYSIGLINYTAACGTVGGTVTVKLYVYGYSAANPMLRKYNPATHGYAPVPGVSFAEQTIGGQTVTVVTYSVTDGGPLDTDGAANGTVIDPVGLATASGAAPETADNDTTLTDTGLNILGTSVIAGALVAVATVVVCRRRAVIYRLR